MYHSMTFNALRIAVFITIRLFYQKKRENCTLHTTYWHSGIYVFFQEEKYKLKNITMPFPGQKSYVYTFKYTRFFNKMHGFRIRNSLKQDRKKL